MAFPSIKRTGKAARTPTIRPAPRGREFRRNATASPLALASTAAASGGTSPLASSTLAPKVNAISARATTKAQLAEAPSGPFRNLSDGWLS
jgi:hypothetical protein